MFRVNSSNNQIYDLLGVGVGPFNLGLCSLLQPVESIQSLFFEAKECFHWHSGMLIGDATLQVPFMADLVTMADPKSPYSYLNYLHEQGRLYQFCAYENFHIPRVEYNRYCQWVSERLDNIQFSKRVMSIEIVDDLFRLTVLDEHTKELSSYLGKDIVLGVGTVPSWPAVAQPLQNHKGCIHSSNYLQKKEQLQQQNSITLVGSGQSAAEIFLDLLREQPTFGYEINWLSRSRGFLSMEYSKLGVEHFSPDYVEYFHKLPEQSRLSTLRGQGHWYKGISTDTIKDIYDCLYIQSIEKKWPIVIQARSELESIEVNENKMSVSFRQLDMQKKFSFQTDALVLATGYEYVFPDCLSSLAKWFEFDSSGHPVVNRDYTLKTTPHVPGNIYVQNAEIHSHGVGAPDLGMGACRSASIVNHLLGRDYYTIRQQNVFQSFGIAAQWAENVESSVSLLPTLTASSA